MQKVLESDWTLDAIKRREEERSRSERATRQADAKSVETHHAADMSGDNWVAAAFRRRQEEERAKAAIHQSSGGGDLTDAASRAIPVDNWLIEGFKRHQEEERRLELIARSEEAGVLTVSEARSSFDAKSLPSPSRVALDETANRAPRAGDEVRRRGGVARKIAIAGVVVVGLVSVIGLKTALWNSVDAPPRGFDRRAPSATPPTKAPPAQKERPRPIQGASQGADTANVPATPPAANGGSASGSTDHPGASAPPKPSDGATISSPPAQAPQNSTGPQPENKAQSPTTEPGDKPPQAIAAPPAASNDPASPARPDSTAKPASVGPEKPAGATGQDQNAAEPNRAAPNANVDAKPKQQARGKSGARHSSGKSEGLSTFLKRTANSVRKFFGRLGTQ